MATATKPQSIVIIGRRWFQKSYGNTYHSATMIIDGETVGTTGIHYGYGDGYLQTAMQQLAKEGLITWQGYTESGSPWNWATENGIKLSYSATDVAREKDL